MNYGEELAYWYLRLNGFFPIARFVVHRSKHAANSSDIDLLAVRLPNVYEPVGGLPDDWDPWLRDQLNFEMQLGVIWRV